jgi:hypothetical protein
VPKSQVPRVESRQACEGSVGLRDRFVRRESRRYNFSKGSELANALDPSSKATGNTRYVLNEIYDSPAGIENHWQEAQQSWGDFAATARSQSPSGNQHHLEV